MASKIDIYNMALGHLGITATVADELERSPEAAACNRFWDTCRDALLSYKDMDWNFASAIEVLADIGSPPDGWGFRYRYPNDCINARDILDGWVRTVPTEFTHKFEVAYQADGRVILCDVESASLRYTKRLAEAERYPAAFVDAISYRLAAMLAMPIANNPGLRNDMLQLSEQFAQIAMAASLNERQQDNPMASIYERSMHA